MSCRLGLEVIPYCSASVTRPSWKRAIQIFFAELASSFARAAPSPLARAASETTWAAWAAWASSALGLTGELLVDDFGGLVDERAGTEDDLDRVRRRELAARPRGAALGSQRSRGDVAGQASLEPQQAVEVRAQHQLLQVAVDEHLDRLFAEAALVALCLAVFAPRARHERAGRSARAQGHRERQPAPAASTIAASSTARGRLAAPPASADNSRALTPFRGGPPTRRRGTGARTDFPMRTAPGRAQIRRFSPSTTPRCAPPPGARS